MKLTILILTGLFFSAAYGQDSPEIKTLKNKLTEATTDTAKVKYCNALSEEYSKTDFDSMKHYSLACLHFAEASGVKKSLRLSYHVMGNAYLHSGTHSDSSLYYFNKALDLAKELNNVKAQIAALQNIAYVYINLSLYEKSLKINMDLLKLREKINDKRGIGNSYASVSIILSDLHRYDEAIKYAELSIKYEEDAKDEPNLMSAYINLSVANIGLKQHTKAIENLLIAKDLSLKLGDKAAYANIVLNLGVVYYEMKDYVRANAILLELTKPDMIEIQDPYSNCNVFLNLGNIYLEQNKPDNAGIAFSKALGYAKAVEYMPGMENAYIGLADLNKKLGNYKVGFENLYHAYNLRDSIYNEEKDRSITEMKIGYEVDKKESDNKQLTEESYLKDQLINQQYVIIASLGLVLLMIVFGGIYLIRQRRTIANQREKILEQKLLQMQLNPHFIFNSLQAVQDYIYSNNEKDASRYLSKFARLMRLTLENSRHENILLSTEIEGLENYLSLQKLRLGTKLNYAIIVNKDIDPGFIEIPPMLLQPFVENAVEHGVKMKNGDGNMNVEFGLQRNILNIKITDDGPGIKQHVETKDTNSHQSLSMKIISERLELFGRKKKYKPNLKISHPGSGDAKGTQVEINIPVEM